MRPPDEPQPPLKAATEGPHDENQSQDSRHDPRTCATCLGYQRWTEDRRADAACYAASAGRRVCDLREAS